MTSMINTNVFFDLTDFQVRLRQPRPSGTNHVQHRHHERWRVAFLKRGLERGRAHVAGMFYRGIRGTDVYKIDPLCIDLLNSKTVSKVPKQFQKFQKFQKSSKKVPQVPKQFQKFQKFNRHRYLIRCNVLIPLDFSLFPP
jgi:hypothetical protein